MSNQNSARPRSVTFSHFCDVAYVAKEDTPSKKWYSARDKKRFHRSLLRDAKQMSTEVGDLPTEVTLTPEQLIECLGIEIFVTSGLAKYVLKTRNAHVAAVLSEQSHQEQQGVCNLQKLSSVSKAISRFSTERARKLAVGYSKLLNE
eukprot:112884_1